MVSEIVPCRLAEVKCDLGLSKREIRLVVYDVLNQKVLKMPEYRDLLYNFVAYKKITEFDFVIEVEHMLNFPTLIEGSHRGWTVEQMQRSINKIFNEIKKAAKADAVVAKKAWEKVQKEKNNDVHN